MFRNFSPENRKFRKVMCITQQDRAQITIQYDACASHGDKYDKSVDTKSEY
jgi:hypothetical protein